jgi:hypothetical protein
MRMIGSARAESSQVPWWGGGVFAALLWVLLLLAAGWWQARWQVEQHLEQERVREDLRQVVRHVRRVSTPESFLQEGLERFCRALRWDRDSAAAVGNRLGEFGRVFVLDAAGKHLKLPGTTTLFSYAAETTVRAIREQVRAGRIPDRQARRMSSSLLGSEEAIGQVAASRGRLVDLRAIGVTKLAAFVPCRIGTQRGFVLAVFDLGLVHIGELTRRGIERIHRLLPPGFSLAVSDLTGRPFEPFARGPHSWETHGRLVEQSELVEEERFYSATMLGREFLVAGSCPLPVPESPLRRHAQALGFGMVVLTVLLWRLLLLALGAGIPVRAQVLTLFGLAAASAVIALLWFAQVWLHVREQAMVRQFQREGEAVLASVEPEFRAFRNQLLQRLNDLVSSLDGQIDRAALERVPARVAPGWRELLTFSIYDETGGVVGTQRPRRLTILEAAFGAEQASLVRNVAKWAIFSAVWRRNRPHSHPDALPDELSRQGSVYQYWVKAILRQAGKYNRARIGAFTFDQFNTFFRDRSGNRYLLMVTFEQNVLERLFLRRIRRHWRSLETPVAMQYQVLGLAIDRMAALSVPQRRGRYAPLAQLADVIRQTRTMQTLKTNLASGEWLLLGQPGQELVRFDLVLGFPLAPIQAMITRQRHGFTYLAGFFLVFALALGWVFAEIVLAPLQTLFGGLRDLSRSRFTTRVHLVSGDEFETLATGVNGLLEEMEGIAQASGLQAHIFRGQTLETRGGFGYGAISGDGSSTVALFEILPLSCQGILFVAALPRAPSLATALVLASVKAEVRLAAEDEAVDLSGLFRRLQALFSSTTQGEASVDLLVGRFDPPMGDQPENPDNASGGEGCSLPAPVGAQCRVFCQGSFLVYLSQPEPSLISFSSTSPGPDHLATSPFHLGEEGDWRCSCAAERPSPDLMFSTARGWGRVLPTDPTAQAALSALLTETFAVAPERVPAVTLSVLDQVESLAGDDERGNVVVCLTGGRTTIGDHEAASAQGRRSTAVVSCAVARPPSVQA